MKRTGKVSLRSTLRQREESDAPVEIQKPKWEPQPEPEPEPEPKAEAPRAKLAGKKVASAARAKAWPEDDYSANRNEWGAMPDGPDAPDDGEDEDGVEEDDDEVFVGRSGREIELEAAREAARAEHRSRRGVAVTPTRVVEDDESTESEFLNVGGLTQAINAYMADLQRHTDFEMSYDMTEQMTFRGERVRLDGSTANVTLRRLVIDDQAARRSIHLSMLGFLSYQFGTSARVAGLASHIQRRHGRAAPFPIVCKMFNSGDEWVLGVRVGPKFYYANVLGQVFREHTVSPQERGYRNDSSIPAIFLDRQARGN